MNTPSSTSACRWTLKFSAPPKRCTIATAPLRPPRCALAGRGVAGTRAPPAARRRRQRDTACDPRRAGSAADAAGSRPTVGPAHPAARQRPDAPIARPCGGRRTGGRSHRPCTKRRRGDPVRTRRTGSARSQPRGIRTAGSRRTPARRSAEARRRPQRRGLCTKGLEVVPHDAVRMPDVGSCGSLFDRLVATARSNCLTAAPTPSQPNPRSERPTMCTVDILTL